MARNQEVERYKRCYRCQTTKTSHVATTDSDDNADLIFTYWCFLCRDHFAYRVRIDIIHDREERI